MSEYLSVNSDNLAKIATELKMKKNITEPLQFPDGFYRTLQSVPNYIGLITRFTQDELFNNTNFYDYDGTLLYSFTPEETKSLFELPPVPLRNPRLRHLGWNWTLSQLKKTTCLGDAALVYDTASEKTEFDISLSPATGKTVKFSDSIVIDDWGDGTVADGSSSHTYENYGDYTVMTSSTVLPTSVIGNSEQSPDIFLVNAFVSSNVKKVETGAFSYCHSLKTLLICRYTKTDDQIAAHEMYSMNSHFFHEGTYASSASVNNLQALTVLSVPYQLKAIKSASFENCSNVKRLILGNVYTIEERAFDGMTSCRLFDFTRCTKIPALENSNAFQNIAVDFKILVLSNKYDAFLANAEWAKLADHIYSVATD